MPEVPIAEILTLVLIAASAIFATKWALTKRLLKEIAEALVTISEAVEDDEITDEELQEILNQLKDIIQAAQNQTGP